MHSDDTDCIDLKSTAHIFVRETTLSCFRPECCLIILDNIVSCFLCYTFFGVVFLPLSVLDFSLMALSQQEL